MNPFYFGSPQRPLFGVHHPPNARTVRGRGVVLCYPLGWEYMRAHRAFRQLAMLLARSGFHVLRFDYFGTGDSAGAGEEGTLEQWVEDAGAAIDELKDMAGIGSVTLVGLRLGGALAALAARGRADLEGVLLWDPIVDGAAYLRELLATAGQEQPAAGRVQGAETVGVTGFPLTAAMRAGIGGIDLRELSAFPAPVALVVSSEKEEYDALRRHLAGAGRSTYRCIPSPGNWAEGDRWGSALLPQAIIQGIVTCLTEEVAA